MGSNANERLVQRALRTHLAFGADLKSVSNADVIRSGANVVHEETSKKTVLVVEDEPLILLLAVAVVEDAGFEALMAANADEALDALHARDDIGIVFTDIDMPGSMDGLKLARTIRERWPPIEILIASGKCRPSKAELPPRSQFFAKPYRVDHITEALRRIAA